MFSSFATVAAFTFSVEMLSFNCSTFTASLLSVPFATLVILLPPLFKPVFVKETVLLSSFELAGLMVMPLFVIFVTALLSPSLNSAEVKPFSSLAN